MDVPVGVPEDPHAAARNNPTDASASARKRNPNCIRVLPLWLVLQPSSHIAATMRGESAPDAGLTHTASSANMNSVASGRRVSSHDTTLVRTPVRSQGGQAPLVGNPPRLATPADAFDVESWLGETEPSRRRCGLFDHKGGRPPLWGTPLASRHLQTPSMWSHGSARPSHPGDAAASLCF